MNKFEYHKYPLHTLPDLGFSSNDTIPLECWWNHARQLTTDELDLIQCGYMWLQTIEKDKLKFPFPPPPKKASYSELWFMLKVLCNNIIDAMPNFQLLKIQEHKARYNATDQVYSYESLIDNAIIISFLCDVICHCAEVEANTLKIKQHYNEMDY